MAERTSLQEMFVALLRVALGCVFLFASVEKIADPSAFAVSIVHYKVLSPTPALLVATVLPWVELLCGLGLVLGIFIRGSALLTMAMLLLFTALVLSAMFRGLDISCGCFTQDPAAGKVGWLKIGENLILIVMNTLVLRPSIYQFSLEHFLRSGTHQTQNEVSL